MGTIYLETHCDRYGITPPEDSSVGHGMLFFGKYQGENVCQPWAIAPDAAQHDVIGGRHGLIAREVIECSDTMPEDTRNVFETDSVWSTYFWNRRNQTDARVTLLVTEINPMDKYQTEDVAAIVKATNPNNSLAGHDIYFSPGLNSLAHVSDGTLTTKRENEI